MIGKRSRRADGTNRDGLGSMRTSLLGSMLFVALTTGCAGSARFTYATDVPDLVEIKPGVRVFANVDEPIFLADNYYWRHQGHRWYRSRYHTHGWARVSVVPPAILTITPSAYVHYHGRADQTLTRRQD